MVGWLSLGLYIANRVCPMCVQCVSITLLSLVEFADIETTGHGKDEAEERKISNHSSEKRFSNVCKANLSLSAKGEKGRKQKVC